jgi:hypothetical protein
VPLAPQAYARADGLVLLWRQWGWRPAWPPRSRRRG